MIPREPPSIPETTHHDEKTKRKSTADPPPLVHQPPPLEDLSGLDLDSQLITHVYNMAMTIAYNLVSKTIVDINNDSLSLSLCLRCAVNYNSFKRPQLRLTNLLKYQLLQYKRQRKRNHQEKEGKRRKEQKYVLTIYST